ncbi:hypothetical protein MPTK1_2g06200 [Marchantia polymorpha subsp. ruderalis]|nr:hypothetical protein MARPO_0021s0075 [Marchantia polymorpha]BBN01291.1 hypothetical protein Mp_2g06200 [Marchantia polymorpha subsp. ruderalis]|eukprot:PTQ44216.1 hypothetical protein MARPO_0021s0075 [Marchantia polymorpha]
MSTAGQVISCTAAVAWEENKPLTLETIQVAPPGANEVRVKLLYGAVCHTDITFMTGKAPAEKIFPRIFGHEAAGVVESVGPGVSEFAEGDHVIPLYQAECSECALCHVKSSNLCTYTLTMTGGYIHPSQECRFSKDGKPIHHFFNTSTFSQYTVVNQANLAKVDPKAPLDKVFLLGCGVTTGHGAVNKVAEVQPGTSVAVFGLGTVGLSVVHAAARAGATKVIAVDINPNKFALAKEFGATDCLNPKDFEKPIQQVLKEMTHGQGVMYSFECVGGNKEVVTSVIECCNPIMGTASMLGTPEAGATIEVNAVFILMGLKLKGAMFGGYRGKTDVPKLVDLYMNKGLDLDKFITDTLPFSRINEAFDKLQAGECLRIALDYSK